MDNKVDFRVYFTVDGDEMKARVHTFSIGAAVASVKKHYPTSKVYKVDVLDEYASCDN